MNIDDFPNENKLSQMCVCVMSVFFVWGGVNLRIVNGLIEIILSRKRMIVHAWQAYISK